MKQVEKVQNTVLEGIAGVALAALFTVADPLRKGPSVREYDGPIAHPMAANLRMIWDSVRTNDRLERVLLRLNSPGGSDVHGQQVIEVLTEIREHAA